MSRVQVQRRDGRLERSFASRLRLSCEGESTVNLRAESGRGRRSALLPVST
jgi:hypothetical protein